MADFNSGWMFNSDAGHNGFFWNGAEYIMIVRMHEVLRFSEDNTEMMAKYILTDQFGFVYDSILQTALYQDVDDFSAVDDATTGIIFDMMDTFGIKEEFSELVVLAFLNEDMKLIEEIQQFGSLLELSEEIVFEDDASSDALLNLIDSFGLKELEHFVQIIFNMRDSFGMTDVEPPPKIAMSDFLIGLADDYDSAYDWLLPFGLKVDWSSTKIQVMPQAELTTIEMPGVDSALVEDAVYKDRLFQIVAFSEQGLTIQEKEEMRTKIVDLLNTTKYKSKKLTVQSRGTSFDVRYEGQAEVEAKSSYVKATIPFRASSYGYRSFESEIAGSGLVKNDGVIPTGVIHRIDGPATNPTWNFGGYNQRWNGTIPAGYSLTIDNGMLSVWLTDLNGKQTNALSKFNGTFVKVPENSSYVLNVPAYLERQFHTIWRDPVLW